MKATMSCFVALVLALSTVLDSGLGCQRSLQNVPVTGIGPLRPLHSSSSFASSAAPSSTINGSEPEDEWEPSTSPSSSSGADDGYVVSTNSSTSAAVDVGGVSTNSSFSSSSSVVYAIETVFTNSSAGEGGPESTNSSASTNVSAVEQELVETLEVDQQVTVLGEVQLGELLCDSLVDAEDAPLLQFAISANETLLVNQTSYLVTGGESFTGGVARRTWIGNVIDPEQTEEEAFPRRVSMTWGEVCDVETFLLEITTHHVDGNTSLTKSVPCGLSGLEICIVEVALDFLPDGPPLTVDFTAGRGLGGSRDLRGGQRQLERAPSGVRARLPHVRERRKLKSATAVQIQALVLYSNQSLDMIGVGNVQMESLVSASIAEVNEGFANSLIGIDLTIVHQTRLPYEEGSSGSGEKLDFMRENSEVQALRNEHGADLVLLVGELYDVCGIAYFLPDTVSGYSEYGYSLVNPNCFSNLVIAHEVGHNLGCDHDREHSSESQEYAHGYRYCSGTNMYTTIMSYTSGCAATRANYFANPNVSYLDRPTGTDTENCARAIEENKEVFSNFRDEIDDGQESSSEDEPDSGDETETTPASTCGNTFDYDDAATACASSERPALGSTLCSAGMNGCDGNLCCVPNETCADYAGTCTDEDQGPAPDDVVCVGACDVSTCCVQNDDCDSGFSPTGCPSGTAYDPFAGICYDGVCETTDCCVDLDGVAGSFAGASTFAVFGAAASMTTAALWGIPVF